SAGQSIKGTSIPSPDQPSFRDQPSARSTEVHPIRMMKTAVLLLLVAVAIANANRGPPPPPPEGCEGCPPPPTGEPPADGDTCSRHLCRSAGQSIKGTSIPSPDQPSSRNQPSARSTEVHPIRMMKTAVLLLLVAVAIANANRGPPPPPPEGCEGCPPPPTGEPPADGDVKPGRPFSPTCSDDTCRSNGQSIKGTSILSADQPTSIDQRSDRPREVQSMTMMLKTIAMCLLLGLVSAQAPPPDQQTANQQPPLPANLQALVDQIQALPEDELQQFMGALRDVLPVCVH
ncbi:hypothetical protein BaRGS_00028691, partial [Batillaria attramentaria]